MTDHSEDIGFLKGKAESNEKRMDKFEIQQNATHTMVTEIHTLLSSHVDQSKTQYEDIEEDLAYCKDGTAEFYQIKRFVIWIGAGFAFLWSSIWKAVDKLFLG